LIGCRRAVADEMHDLDADDARVVLTLYRLLARGEPVGFSEIAEEAGIDLGLVEKRLEQWPGVFTQERAVVGFWGMAIPKVSHRFEVGGKTLYTWCAYDALFLSELIGKTATVRSHDPVTGEEIRLVVHPDQIEGPNPQDIVISFLDPATTRFDENVILNFCNYVHFFTSRESGSKWVADNPGTFLLSLDDSFRVAHLANRTKFGEALDALAPRGHLR
jgi:alkylmercury lyase